MSDVIKLLDEREVDEVPRKMALEVPLWWFVAVILLQIVGMVYAQYDRSAQRRELDEHAALIKQVQEIVTVKSLAKIK